MPRQFIIQGLLDVSMVIPIARIQGDKADTRLDEAASHQGLLSPARAVAITSLLVLERDIEGRPGLAGGNDVHRLLQHAVHAVKGAGLVDVTAQSIQPLHQGDAGRNLLGSKSIEQLET